MDTIAVYLSCSVGFRRRVKLSFSDKTAYSQSYKLCKMTVVTYCCASHANF